MFGVVRQVRVGENVRIDGPLGTTATITTSPAAAPTTTASKPDHGTSGTSVHFAPTSAGKHVISYTVVASEPALIEASVARG
jgi:hypothetical protein